jgi:uncharacterized delta-60 repeat protein
MSIDDGFEDLYFGEAHNYDVKSVVHTIETQEWDNKIVAGGNISAVNAITVSNVVRFHPDGSLDVPFNDNIISSGGFSDEVLDIAIQADKKIIVVGLFTTFNGNTRLGICRLNTDGTEDTTFYSNLTSTVNFTSFDKISCIEILPDGKIMLGGNFEDAALSVHHALRLNEDGSEDSVFTGNFGTINAQVLDIAYHTEGYVILVGDFTSLQGNSLQYIVRIDRNGFYDSGGFNSNNTGTDSSINVVTVQKDLRILIGGDYSTFDGISNRRLSRLMPNGSADSAFNNNVSTKIDSTVMAIEVQPDERIVVLCSQFLDLDTGED